jgi:hypothetical protein
MAAHVLERRAAPSSLMQSLRRSLARVARAFDALVSARATRSVPEWRMREVRRDINRHLGLIRAGELRRQNEQADSAAASKGATSLSLAEFGICNFSR